MEQDIQSRSTTRERLVLTMNATSLLNFAVEAPAYVALQREMHDALRTQNPEWILPNGDSPTVASYDARFAELLIQSLPQRHRGLKKNNSHQSQSELQ